MSDAFESEETVTIPIKTFRILAWVFSALIAGGGGAFAVRSTNPATYDRFTGDDGEKLAQELKQFVENTLAPVIRDIVKLESRADQCQKKIDNLPPRYLLAEVADMQKQALVTRTQYQSIVKIMDGILKHDRDHANDFIKWQRKLDRNTQELKHLRERYGLPPNPIGHQQ